VWLGVLSGKICTQMVVVYVTCDQDTECTRGSLESMSSKLCLSSEQDDDMIPSGASVVFGKSQFGNHDT
jgi:hypothetical protein